MLTYTTEGDNNSETAGKGYKQNPTTDEHHWSFATGIFHCHTGQAKLSQANFYSIHVLKGLHFPGKINNIPPPGVFLEASLPLQ